MHVVTVNGRVVHKSEFLPEKKEKPEPYNGSAKWKALHLAALTNSITTEWLTEWRKDIPTFGCTCLSDWLRWLDNHPLPTENQFAWSVKAHNAVNAKMKKPLLSEEEARAVWAVDSPASA